MSESVRRNQYPKGFGVNVVGFVTARLGLGVAVRSTISALVKAGIAVATVDLNLQDGRSGHDNTWSHLQIRTPTTRLPYPVTLVHVNPLEAAGVWANYPHWFESQTTFIVPFSELADVPDSWLAELARYDAVLAPTEHIAAAVRNSVAVPVRSFPPAVDTDDVATVERARFAIPEDKVAFVATWDYASGINRKNICGTLRAFAAALDFGADAVLVVKQQNASSFGHPEIDRELARMPESSVIFIDSDLPYPQLLGLYQACDVFLSLHRAEGLGLGILEAMLLGKPVITTGWSGNMDFVDESCASLVRYTLTPVVDTQPAYSPANFSRQQLWAEPDIFDAARRIYTAAVDEHHRTVLGKMGHERAISYVDQARALVPHRILSLYHSAQAA